MSVPFFKNFFGLRCNDFELLRVPYPRLELTIHVTFKTVETGAVLGSLLVGPLKAAIDGSRDPETLFRSALIYGFQGAVVGLAMGPVLSLLRQTQLKKFQIYDRCYRLRFNRNQLNMDRAVLFGAVVGAGVAGPAGMVVGIDVATVGGLLAYLAFASKKNLVKVL